MDIVIPYIADRNEDLRYCLRGIDKYLPHGQVFIIGDPVPYLDNSQLIHIPVENAGRSRDSRIWWKIMRAVSDQRVSDSFIFFNDDHFLTAGIEIIPYWYDGSLEEIAAYRRYNDGYTKALQNTLKWLRDHKCPTRHFDGHTPIVYQKAKLKALADVVDWEIAWGYVIKSLYCNVFAIEGEYAPDCKIRRSTGLDSMLREISGRAVFSTHEHAYPVAAALFRHLYPEKSKFEI